MKLAIVLIVVSIMGAAVGAALLGWKNANDRADVIEETDRDVRARLDSIMQRQARLADSADARHAAQLRELRAVQVAIADSLRGVRESIPAPDSTVRDSLRYWRSTALVAVAEVGQLRTALAVADSVSHAMTVTAARVAAERDSAWVRTRDLSQGLDRVTAELRRLPPPCKIAWMIDCPSRTASFVGGAATALLAVVVSR